MQRRVRVGLIAPRPISTIHADALRRCAPAKLWAVTSPTPGNAERFAGQRGLRHTVSNDRHFEVTRAADPRRGSDVQGRENQP